LSEQILTIASTTIQSRGGLINVTHQHTGVRLALTIRSVPIHRQRLWPAAVAGIAACVTLAGLPAMSIASGAIAPPPASGGYVVKRALFGGLGIGGGLRIAPGGKAITGLQFTFPSSRRDVCPASVDVVGKLALRNLTGTNQHGIHISDWFFGRWSSPDANLKPKRVTLETGGKRLNGRLSLAFIHTSARVSSRFKEPEGEISFTLPAVGAPCGTQFTVKR
jgi:hypothetical protein